MGRGWKRRIGKGYGAMGMSETQRQCWEIGEVVMKQWVYHDMNPELGLEIGGGLKGATMLGEGGWRAWISTYFRYKRQCNDYLLMPRATDMVEQWKSKTKFLQQ